jgi:hypothetical protein
MNYKKASIYECDGPFEFSMQDEDEDDEEWY